MLFVHYVSIFFLLLLLLNDLKLIIIGLKYPKKHRVLLNFLSGILREEGGFDYKKTIVDTILEIIDVIPGAKEHGLFHLCEVCLLLLFITLCFITLKNKII